MRGGKRPRSGRPKGSPNKATAERQAAVSASGITPLAIMVENARWAYAEAARLTERLVGSEPSLDTLDLLREIIRFRGLAVEWAHMAAPYVHPRLAAVAHRHTNLDGSPVRPVVNVIIHGVAPETPRFAETVPSISDKRH
jgi:hypothetical protein